MKISETDPRVLRTRGLMRSALMELAAEKSFSSLNVQDITARAGLNRSTFYLHYKGLHELLEDCAYALFDEMRQRIVTGSGASGVWQSPDLFIPFAARVFEHLADHKTFYRAMLGRQGDPYFRALFQELLAELIFEPFSQAESFSGPSLRDEMILQFFSGGFTAVASWWLEKDMPVPVAEAAKLVATNLLPDYINLIKQN